MAEVNQDEIKFAKKSKLPTIHNLPKMGSGGGGADVQPWQKKAVANKAYGQNQVYDTGVSPNLARGGGSQAYNQQSQQRSAQQRTMLNEQMYTPQGEQVFGDQAYNKKAMNAAQPAYMPPAQQQPTALPQQAPVYDQGAPRGFEGPQQAPVYDQGAPRGFEGPQLPGQGTNNFNSEYMQQNYGGLNNKTKNDERFDRNRADALKQDQASGEMVNRLNRGTNAMRELSQMRSGDSPTLTNPLPTGDNLTPEQKNAQNRLQFDKNKFAQETSNKSTQFDADIEKQLGSVVSNPKFRKMSALIEQTQDPNVRAQYMANFLQETGLPYDIVVNYMQKMTNPKSNDLGAILNIK